MRLIDADVIIEHLKTMEAAFEEIFIASVIRELKDAPTIDPESLRPQGKWIGYHEADIGWDEWGCRCSNCKWEVEDEKITFPMNYCPNCGAKMKEKDTLWTLARFRMRHG